MSVYSCILMIILCVTEQSRALHSDDELQTNTQTTENNQLTDALNRCSEVRQRRSYLRHISDNEQLISKRIKTLSFIMVGGSLIAITFIILIVWHGLRFLGYFEEPEKDDNFKQLLENQRYVKTLLQKELESKAYSYITIGGCIVVIVLSVVNYVTNALAAENSILITALRWLLGIEGLMMSIRVILLVAFGCVLQIGIRFIYVGCRSLCQNTSLGHADVILTHAVARIQYHQIYSPPSVVDTYTRQAAILSSTIKSEQRVHSLENSRQENNRYREQNLLLNNESKCDLSENRPKLLR